MIKIRTKLVLLFLTPITLFSLLIFTYFAILTHETSQQRELSKKSIPLLHKLTTLKKNILLSNVALTEWMITANKKKKGERDTLWRNRIYPSFFALTHTLKQNGYSEKLLQKLIFQAHMLYTQQNEIEAIQHTTSNYPASMYLLKKGGPVLKKIYGVSYSIDDAQSRTHSDSTFNSFIFRRLLREGFLRLYQYTQKKSHIDLTLFYNMLSDANTQLNKLSCQGEPTQKPLCQEISLLKKLMRTYRSITFTAVKITQSEHQNISKNIYEENIAHTVNSIVTMLTDINLAVYNQNLDAMKSIETTNRLLAWILLGSFLLLILITLYVINHLTKSIIQPISSLTQATKAAQAGEHPIDVQYTPQDEIGILVDAFNTMRKAEEAFKEEIIEKSNALEKMSHFDMMTRLPNMLYFREHISQPLTATDKPKCIIFIELDQISVINASFGHDAGNLVIKTVADMLQKNGPESNFIARFSGHQFVVFSPTMTQSYEAMLYLDALSNLLATPLLYHESKITVTFRAGVSFFPTDAKKLDELITCAITALKQVKPSAEKNYAFFSRQLAKENQRDIIIAKLVSDTDNFQYFHLAYQPIYDLKSKNVHSLEVLLRVEHPDLEIISPLQVIRFAERQNTIHAITRWVIETALTELYHIIPNISHTPIQVAFNLSAKDLTEKNIVEILQIFSEYASPSIKLQVEITETALSESIQQIPHLLSKLKQNNVTISLDDFGTGYSSLSRLRLINVDELKIDQSFIQNLSENHENYELTKTIIQLGHALNMVVLAEGVETQEQYNLLDMFGCDLVQGFYFSKPVRIEEIEKIL